MDACCKKDAENEKKDGCCEECPNKGCEGCECSKPENTSGCCGSCECENR